MWELGCQSAATPIPDHRVNGCFGHLFLEGVTVTVTFAGHLMTLLVLVSGGMT